MAKLSAHGRTEKFRYFSPKHRCLLAFMSDGVILRRTAYSNGWKVAGKCKIPVDQRVAHIQATMEKWPSWLCEIKTLPSVRTLERWLHEDGMCETPSGDTVEPDGTGSDGAPSWLRLLRMI
nr:hypothetical protein [uncultured Rhodopila sp.]